VNLSRAKQDGARGSGDLRDDRLSRRLRRVVARRVEHAGERRHSFVAHVTLGALASTRVSGYSPIAS